MRDQITATQIAELTTRILQDIKEPSKKVFYLGYKELCKKQAMVTPANIMQFKYAGTLFYIEGDKPNPRAQPLHPSLMDDFLPMYQFYVVDMLKLLSRVRYMISDLTRIAVTHEDLYKLLPESLYPSLDKSSYCTSATQTMSEKDAEEFKKKYQSLFSDITLRIFLGVVNN